jgi:hypothetical protein
MKKLIKLLFPKTYDSIYREGFSNCYEIYVTYENYPDENFSDEEFDQEYNSDYDEYPEGYWDDSYHTEEIYEEIEQIHTENSIESVCIPKLEINDKVHLHSKKGIYTVTEVYIDSFAYTTSKAKKNSYALYEDYKCHVGGIRNKGE